MKMTQSLFILASLILSAHLMAKVDGHNVIYGEDNRKDVFESTNASYIELSKSTAAMINASNLNVLDNGDVVVNGRTLESRGVCAKERFSKQISAANCSGFLVGDNKLVTAGHCIKSEADCNSYKWVFDFKVDFAEQGKVNVPKSSVFSCKRIISRSLDSYRKISKGDELVVIGHPTGLPTKIADGAKVRSLQGKFFVANLDTYGGNSGSAVFNVQTEEVEGILVRGENDYVSSNMGCQVSNVCTDEGCRGEDVTYITNIEGL